MENSFSKFHHLSIHLSFDSQYTILLKRLKAELGSFLAEWNQQIKMCQDSIAYLG